MFAVATLDKSLSIWFDDVDISAFHSCVVVVDLWQTISVCVCFGLPPRGCRSGERILNFLLNLEKVERKSERCWCKFTGENAMKKTAVYKWVKCFSEGRDSVTEEERSGRPATSRTEETLQKFVKLCVKIIG